MKTKKSKDNYNIDVDHWTEPSGCHPDCPACEKPTHTPTPWKINQAGENIYLYVDVPSEHWPTHAVIANLDDDMGNAKENAAHIVKCVNAHEELLNLLYTCQGFTQALALGKHEGAILLHKEITQAIAKAEGKP